MAIWGKDKTMKVESVPIDQLVEDPKNARVHGEKNLKSIRASLEKFGQVEALVVRKGSNVVIGGNGRLAVMKELGWESVFVTYQELTDAKAKALAIALNRAAEDAEWNNDQLIETLEELNDVGEDTAWMDFEFDLGSLDPPPALPPIEPPPRQVSFTAKTKKHTCPECAHEFTV